MKTLKYTPVYRYAFLGILVLASSLFFHACGDDGPVKWVDLRYKTADEYRIGPTGAEPIVIQVKSTDPWTVYSNHHCHDYSTCYEVCDRSSLDHQNAGCGTGRYPEQL